jgi:hypothetical protein
MTDGELAKAATRLNRLHYEASMLIEKIGDHPNGEQIIEDMFDNGMGHTWSCGLIVHEHMVHPERWEWTENDILRYKKGRCTDDN